MGGYIYVKNMVLYVDDDGILVVALDCLVIAVLTAEVGDGTRILAAVLPTSMIFVPCAEGISHNEAEYSSPEQLSAGANVLLHAILDLANQ